MQWITSVGDCDCATVLLATATVVVVLVHILKSGKPKNLPPGPIGLPIVGYAPFLGNNAVETLRKLKSKYGSVMTVRMGTDDWVILNNNETINEEVQLVQFVRNLFEAGTVTVSSTLSWAILCFAHYPECQERIHGEIEKVLGDSGIPTMKHRDEMPYTCAFIHELMRHRTVVPLTVPHKTNEEATLRGYRIPKNTTVVPNIWAVHMDPELFENPEEFRPERYLDSDGKFVPSNHVIPFSVGPRHCLGEQIGRMNIFIFLTGIVQRLKILPDPNHPPPPFLVGDFSNMITFDPLEFAVKLEKC